MKKMERNSSFLPTTQSLDFVRIKMDEKKIVYESPWLIELTVDVFAGRDGDIPSRPNTDSLYDGSEDDGELGN